MSELERILDELKALARAEARRELAEAITRLRLEANRVVKVVDALNARISELSEAVEKVPTDEPATEPATPAKPAAEPERSPAGTGPNRWKDHDKRRKAADADAETTDDDDVEERLGQQTFVDGDLPLAKIGNALRGAKRQAVLQLLGDGKAHHKSEVIYLFSPPIKESYADALISDVRRAAKKQDCVVMRDGTYWQLKHRGVK